MPEYMWTGDEDVRCEIEVEPVGDRRPPKIFKATVRRILRDGLLPLALRDGRPVEYVETSETDAIARAKLFLDRRFGLGALEAAKDATAGMRLFTLQRVPETLVIAAYGRYGCPVCRIGEPDDEKLDRWIQHAQREHGYEVVTDGIEAAPGLPDLDRGFRVVRLRHIGTLTTVVSEPEASPESGQQEDGVGRRQPIIE